MSKQFRLHAHEVWREKLVRTGTYQEEGDLSEFALDEWEDNRFLWSCYSARRGENELFGHLMFRPRSSALDENFFVAGEIRRGREEAFLCRPAEFAFDKKPSRSALECALSGPAWGRVFYLTEELELRGENALMPCDWGVFIASNGLGVWKWAGRDGVSWSKASVEGTFRWAEDSAETTKFLAQQTSSQVWEHLKAQLEDEDWEMAFARQWLQMEVEVGGYERFDAVAVWKQGSREECERVVKLLLLITAETQEARDMVLYLSLQNDEFGEEIFLRVDKSDVEMPARLKSSVKKVRDYFGASIREPLPLCVSSLSFDLGLIITVESPTAHERLEAQLQLRQWCEERDFSL